MYILLFWRGKLFSYWLLIGWWKSALLKFVHGTLYPKAGISEGATIQKTENMVLFLCATAKTSLSIGSLNYWTYLGQKNSLSSIQEDWRINYCGQQNCAVVWSSIFFYRALHTKNLTWNALNIISLIFWCFKVIFININFFMPAVWRHNLHIIKLIHFKCTTWCNYDHYSEHFHYLIPISRHSSYTLYSLWQPQIYFLPLGFAYAGHFIENRMT